MHYVVINEWTVDNGEIANGVEIIAVCHSEEEAREAFEKRLPEEQDCARDSGWTVYEHDDVALVFDAGKEGFYDAEHTKLYVESVQQKGES